MNSVGQENFMMMFWPCFYNEIFVFRTEWLAWRRADTSVAVGDFFLCMGLYTTGRYEFITVVYVWYVT